MQFLQLPGDFRFHRRLLFRSTETTERSSRKNERRLSPSYRIVCRPAIKSDSGAILRLLTHIATTESFVVEADDKLTALLELESEIGQAKSSILLESPLGRNPSEPCEKFRVRPNFEVFCNYGLQPLFQTMCVAATAGFTRCGEAGCLGLRAYS
jgi:hypothetical protein